MKVSITIFGFLWHDSEIQKKENEKKQEKTIAFYQMSKCVLQSFILAGLTDINNVHK